MSDDTALRAARQVLDRAVMTVDGKPVGTTAACAEGKLAADNYDECFVRDFAVSGMVYLADGKADIVRNFLASVLEVRQQEPRMDAHAIQPGIMPASFCIKADENGHDALVADFGDRAIGRVAPVDSMMWWMVLLHAYTQVTGDRSLVERDEFQEGIELVLNLCLTGSFEVFPTLLVPDASFMIDRRMGVYGHPLEIQSLFYAMLHTVGELFDTNKHSQNLGRRAAKRHELLCDYVRTQYWLDSSRLSEINRFATEEFGVGGVNALNIYPESIPQWLERWLPEKGGFFAGNLGPERMDYRFFGLGNLLAIVFGLASPEQAESIMDLYEQRWDDLVGMVPMKICFPAMEGEEWRVLTGCDRKNEPWSYHNGGNWPVLLWAFVAAALIVRRRELAERAVEQARQRLGAHDWPEYYDGRSGRLIGRRANRRQTWTAAAFIFAHQLLENPELLAMFPGQPTLEEV